MLTSDPTESDSPLRFDHVAVGAPTLAAGADWVAARLGVAPPPGGAHPLMGTHNRLSATGPDSFLELIAVDPAAPPPGRARWFGLDDPATLAGGPRPVGLVLGVDDLDAALAAARAAGVEMGRPLDVSRGDLRWRFAVRDDGAIPLDGAAPLLIEWPAGPHPAGRMTDQGLRYREVAVETPDPERLTALLDALGGAPAPVVVRAGGRAALRVTVATAGGAVSVLAA